ARVADAARCHARRARCAVSAARGKVPVRTNGRTAQSRPAVPLSLSPPERTGQTGDIARAAEAAIRFWEQVRGSEHVRSEEFRKVAIQNREVVARFARTFAR